MAVIAVSSLTTATITTTATATATSVKRSSSLHRRFAVGTKAAKHLKKRAAGAAGAGAAPASRLDIMSALGSMKPEVVADGVLHVRTPLIISKPMR